MASPAAELGIDAGLVRRLLVEQQPGLADLSIRIIANGWDNVVVRLGSDLTVRLPRRQASAQLLLNEQRWLPELAACTIQRRPRRRRTRSGAFTFGNGQIQCTDAPTRSPRSS